MGDFRGDGQDVVGSDNASGDFAPGLITLKVRDVAGISQAGSSAFLFTYPSSVKLEEFVNDAAKRFDVSKTEFELVYQDLKKGEIHEIGTYPPEETFSVMDIVPSRQKEYSVSLERKKLKKKNKETKQVVRRLDAELSAVAPNNEPQSMIIDVIGDTSSKAVVSRDVIYNEFVGLSNLSMTCYLNSLLQSLFFTPEIRNALYNYQYVDDIRKKKSIAFALQKLFLQLQFSCRRNVGTEELTNTFGWKGEEVWIQHDISDLFMLLMEHLSEEFKQTPQQEILSGLYGGILTDYVECQNCMIRNCKEELFLALPLPVRVFGSPLKNPTLEEALRSFIVPEILDDKNQYNCERCQKPCDAKKGFSFKKLPYILTIALKRFEYNFERQSRHKLNDKVIFPNILDMNDMVDAGPDENKESDLVPPIKPELVNPQGESKRDKHSRPFVNLSNFAHEDTTDEGIEVDEDKERVIPLSQDGDENSQTTKNLQECLRNGPNVYQLYAILIHRGTVSGGHYYSFVRDFETGQWYRFDDTSVRRIQDQDIRGTYGGIDSYLDGKVGENLGVAYMLIYRRYDPELNALPMTYELLPPHIRSLWDNMKNVDKNQHDKEELDRNTIRMTVFTRFPDSLEVYDHREMNLLKSATMQEAAMTCFNEFFPNEIIQPQKVRLVRFDRDLSIIENSFDNKEEEIVCIALKHPSAITKMEGLLLEVQREPTNVFESYHQTDLIFVSHIITSAIEDFGKALEIHMSADSTVRDLRKKLATAFKLEEESIMMAHKVDNSISPSVEFLELDKNDIELTTFFGRVTQLYTESCKTDEQKATFVNFITNYSLSLAFEIKIQLPSEIKSDFVVHDDGITQFPMEPPGLTPVSPSSFQYSDIGNAEEILGNCSDPSTSEDSSLTGSDRTLVVDTDVEGSKVSSSQSSPTKVIPICEINESGEIEDWDQPTSDAGKTKFYFRLLADRKSENGEWQILTVRADRLMPAFILSQLIKDLTGIEEKNFVMFKVNNGTEDEILDFRTQLCSMGQLDEINGIKCTIGQRLQKGDFRVDVYLLQLENLGSPIYIKEFILNATMTVAQAMAAITQEVNSMNLNIDATYGRLRKKVKSTPSRVLKPENKLSDALGNCLNNKGNEIFFQVMDGPDQHGGKYHSVIIRRWKPSEWVLEEPQEIAIPHDYTQSPEDLVLEKLAEVLDISRENIQVALPESNGSIPYSLNPLIIQERLHWLTLCAPTARRKIYIFNDELFLFVRDKTDAIKPLSSVERQELEKSIESQQQEIYDFTISPRREFGLYLNLARTPPT